MRIEIDARDQTFFIQAVQAARAREAARTGVHCSTIVNDIAAKTLDTRDHSGIDPLTGLAFQEIGNVIEDIVADGLVARYPGWVKPASFKHRGIWCSPDGESERSQTIDEVKARWGHCREFLELDGAPVSEFEAAIGELTGESGVFTKYKLQVLFYTAARGFIRSRLHILFLNGTFRPPFPKPVTLRMRPTRAELADNEELIIQHARDIGLLTRRDV
jgi:hypothetical protein